MQERGNKFKPLSKKEVHPPTNLNQQTALTQNSKLSSNSQNKLFIRKPVSKRHGFVSPNFTKNRGAQNEEVKSPTDQMKSKKSIQSDSHSDKDYWENSEKPLFNNKISLKRYISNQQNFQQQFNQFNSAHVINEAYFGNDLHALTQIGQHYKVQTIESDNSQKDLYFGQNMKKNTKQNIVVNSLNINAKKVTRTEYFINTNTEEVRSTTSRSLRQKQLNFNQLKHSVNNNIDAYVLSLQENIRKLEKNNYTLNKKSKWMHQQVEMHLEKQHLMIAEKKGFEIQLKSKEKQIETLNQQKQDLRKQLDELKLVLEKKLSCQKNKSFKDLETISSLKQFCTKIQQKCLGRQNQVQQSFQGYFGNTPSSIQKNKKHSFKTYPGVCSPKKYKEDGSKCSSIVGSNESFQDFRQSSVLYAKSNIKKEQSDIKSSFTFEDLKKQRDSLRYTLDKLKEQMNALKKNNIENVNLKSQQFEQKLNKQEEEIDKLKDDLQILQNEKDILSMQMDKMLVDHHKQVDTLNLKIRQLETQVSLNSRHPYPSGDLKDFQEQNPLKYFLEDAYKGVNYEQQSQTQHLQHENKSLRVYIQKIMEHYKYIKIENRMLLKVKQDKQKLQKEKKQIKQERDSFKKKLLEMIKNKSNSFKQIKSNKRLMDFGSQSSSEESSAVFELSQSEIKHESEKSNN